MNTDAKSHLAKTPEKCFREVERVKKKMYLESCLQQHQHFSHFVTSVDGLLGVEDSATLKRKPATLQESGGSPTPWRVDTSRLGLPSLWCIPHTGASGSPGLWSTRSASIARSGKTEPVSTCSGKRAVISPDKANPPPCPNALNTLGIMA